MNRTILVLSIAAILLFSGGMVIAEEGKNMVNADGTLKVTVADVTKAKNAMKFHIETDADVLAHAEKRAEHAALKQKLLLRIKGILPSNLDEETREALSHFNLDDATLARIRALSSTEQERAWGEIRTRYRARIKNADFDLRVKNYADHANAVAAAHRLEGKARHAERLRLAILIAERHNNATLKARLEAIRAKIAAQADVSAADEAEVDAAIWEQRVSEFTEKAPAAIAQAERIIATQTRLISRIEFLVDNQEAAGRNTARIEVGLDKMKKLQVRLSEQLEDTKADWSIYSDEPTKDGLKTVHHDLVQLNVLSRNAVHNMHVMVRFIKHFSDNDGQLSADVAAAYEGALVDEADVTLGARAEADAVVGTSIELDDSDESETDDSGMDSAEDILENTIGGTV